MDQPQDKDPQLQALISLLDEPDQQAFTKVRDRIFAYGSQAVPLLETAWESTFDSYLQKRIEDIIHSIQYNQLYLDLTNWAHFRNDNLLEGYLLFTRYQYQNMYTEEVKSQLHDIRRDIWLELNNSLTALEKVKVLNHIIFDLHKFQLPSRQTTEPRYLFLNNLLETRSGFAISIGILYTLLAQSLDLPVHGILLPGERFVMAWLDETEKSPEEPARVMFYINPENKGGIFTRNEIVTLLRRLKLSPDDMFFRPVAPKYIISKMFELLSYLLATSGEAERAGEIDHLRSALI